MNRQRWATDKLGAAAWLPSDLAYFWSTQRIQGLFRDIANSTAVESLSELPMFANAWRQIDQQQFQLSRARGQNALLDDALTLLGEAADREIFVAGGAATAPFATALADLVGNSMLLQIAANLRGTRPNPTAPLIQTIREHGEQLRLPPTIVGMRVSSVDRARNFITKLTGLTSVMPGKVESLTAAGTEYQVWRLSTNDIPNWRRQLSSAMRFGSASAEDQRVVADWLAGQQVAIAAGVRGDYLLFSIADSTEHLHQLGRGAPLATLSVFARARQRNRTPLALTYVSPAMRDRGAIDVEAIAQLADNALASAPPAPGVEMANHKQQFLADLRVMLREVNDSRVPAAPLLSTVFRQRGLETLTVSSSTTSGPTEPLAVLRHAGDSPLFAMASRATPVVDAYRRAAHWTRVMFGHFEHLAVPHLQATERGDFHRFRETVIPALTELDDVMQNSLLPATEGSEGLLLLDGAATFALPADWFPLAETLRLPQPAMVFRVNDAEQVVTACGRMRTIVGTLLQRAAASAGAPAFELPAFESRKVDGGTQYRFGVDDLAPELLPCALVNDNTIVVALSLEHAQRVMAREQRPSSELIDGSQPANGFVRIDIASSCRLLRDGIDVMLAGMVESRRMPTGQARMENLRSVGG